MAQKEYIYPDVDDTNTLIFIENNEPYKGYWEKSENEVLNQFRSLSKKKNHKKILDIGTGNGRLIPYYQNFFSDITVIDPDIKRLNVAKGVLKNHKNVKFIQSTLLNSNLKDEKYDIILCAHVLQIIRTPYIKQFVAKMYKHLKPEGRLVILCTHAKGNKDYYKKNYIAYSDIKSKFISQKEFNSLRINRENVLATHHYSIKILKNLFSQFRILDVKIFHILHRKNWVDKLFFRDHYYNMHPLKKHYGEDVYFLLKRK